MVTQLQHKAPAQTFAFLNKGPLVYSCLLGRGGFPLCPTKLIVCLVQRLTNLIQIFRWPDKGYSPLLPPLITTAINWPVWTRDLLHMKQASAALVTWETAAELSWEAWEATSLRRYPSSPLCLGEGRVTDLQRHMIFLLSAVVCQLPHSRNVTQHQFWWLSRHPHYSPPKSKGFFSASRQTWTNTPYPSRLAHDPQGQKTWNTCSIRLRSHCWVACNLIHDRWNCLVRIPSLNTNFPPCLNKHSTAGCLSVFPMPCLEVERGARHHTDSKQQTVHKQLPALLVTCTLWGPGLTVRLMLRHQSTFGRCRAGAQYDCTLGTTRGTSDTQAAEGNRKYKLHKLEPLLQDLQTTPESFCLLENRLISVEFLFQHHVCCEFIYNGCLDFFQNQNLLKYQYDNPNVTQLHFLITLKWRMVKRKWWN